MAEQSTHDVVNQAQSASDASPSDVTATKNNQSTPSGDAERTLDFPTSDPEVQEPLSISQTDGVVSIKPSTNQNLSEIPAREGIESHHNGDTQPKRRDEVSEEREIQINGYVDGLSVIGDTHGQQTFVDASGGSDTDTSKPDTLESTEKTPSGDKHHVRSNSVKKPTSFKAVSVTKNFLAKAAVGTSPASKGSGDKAAGQSSTLTQLAPRPRLVAKSASGLRDAAPRPAQAANNTARGNGPDPNQVWNRNRPVQPPPPKQFTDEELKQQYGIHLATRLQADEAGKEAKWADIDDDEDDWAPETIEWNDGTKITLSHTEQPIAAEEQAIALAAQEKLTEAEKVKSATQQLSAAGPNTTILKVGSSVNGLSKTGGLVLKGATEKPTLVAKPTAPTTVKSPWASLPPVDKVPPMPINLPQQQQSISRFQRDPHGFDSVPPSPSPAKEIAADDFNRSWRDSTTSSRELFNSQSGQYEPVKDARRGSMRNDQGFRQPSVLQRPSHDQQSPAEPSAAFQTSRSSGQEVGAWGRRRTSSNVSGGSGNQGRRVSFGVGQEMPPPPSELYMQQRRGSQQGGLLESVPSPRNFSPSGAAQHQQSSQRGFSPAQSNPHHQRQQLQSPVTNHAHLIPTSGGVQNANQAPSNVKPAETQDPVAMQQQIMRESRETAKKRKLEQEAKEEAEKKERIRLKMVELGMPPLGEKKEKDQEKSKEAEVSQPQPPKETIIIAELPAKTSIPDIPEEVKQYGLMKGHSPAKTSASINETAPNQAVQAALPNRRVSSPSNVKSPDLSKVPGSPPKNVSPNFTTAFESSLAHNQDHAAQSPPKDHQKQPWKNVPPGNDTYTSWSAAGMTTHSTPGLNLWGPPSNDKALGNGTFDRSFTRLPQRHGSQQQQISPPAPGPIGPPNALQRSLESSRSPQQQGSVVIAPVQEDLQITPSFSPPKSQPIGSGSKARIEGNPIVTSASLAVSPPGPIAPPKGPSTKSRSQRAQLSSAWKSLPAQLAQEDTEEQQKAAQEHAARLQEEARTGTKHEPPQPTFNETWRQVVVDNSPGQRHIVNVSRMKNGDGINGMQQNGASSEPPSWVIPSEIPPTTSAPVSAPGGGRGSRFFPHSADGLRGQTVRPASYSYGYTPPLSPPPPDSISHPAYDGDIRRPMVKLSIPKPVVRLPPPVIAPIAPPTPASRPASIASTRAVSQPIVNTASWQDRINGLFGRKKLSSSPPKTHALAVNSATKAPLEVPPIQASATVSLPRSEDDDMAPTTDKYPGDSGEVTSKATEEALLEEREFGSLPIVKLPVRAPTNAWRPARPPPTMRSKSKFQKSTETQSVLEPFLFEDKENMNPDRVVVFVRIPGVQGTKSKIMPLSCGSPRDTPRQRGPFSNLKRKGQGQGLKSRESSGNFQSPRPNQIGSPRPPMQGGPPRSGFSSGNWSQRVSGTVQ
ncbi:MAG: hypothetical protein M1827_002291 [Pycnora praestabilis]|nr:MAG: hypothetical protein M1827_002291 [Pycnora praestabilis]